MGTGRGLRLEAGRGTGDRGKGGGSMCTRLLPSTHCLLSSKQGVSTTQDERTWRDQYRGVVLGDFLLRSSFGGYCHWAHPTCRHTLGTRSQPNSQPCLYTSTPWLGHIGLEYQHGCCQRARNPVLDVLFTTAASSHKSHAIHFYGYPQATYTALKTILSLLFYKALQRYI